MVCNIEGTGPLYRPDGHDWASGSDRHELSRLACFAIPVSYCSVVCLHLYSYHLIILLNYTAKLQKNLIFPNIIHKKFDFSQKSFDIRIIIVIFAPKRDKYENLYRASFQAIHRTTSRITGCATGLDKRCKE